MVLRLSLTNGYVRFPSDRYDMALYPSVLVIPYVVRYTSPSGTIYTPGNSLDIVFEMDPICSKRGRLPRVAPVRSRAWSCGLLYGIHVSYGCRSVHCVTDIHYVLFVKVAHQRV